MTRSQLSRVSARSEELRRCAETVERRVRDSAEDSLEALSAVEARAAALLQAQAADVRRQLEATERCAADVHARSSCCPMCRGAVEYMIELREPQAR